MEAAKRLPTPAPNCHADPLSRDAEEYDGTLTTAMRNSSVSESDWKQTYICKRNSGVVANNPSQLTPEEKERLRMIDRLGKYQNR